MMGEAQVGSGKVSVFDLLFSFSEAIDLISPALVSHHKYVSFLSYHLGKKLGFPAAKQMDLAVAGALHDVGGLSLESRLGALAFDVQHPEDHTLPGYLLLKTFPPFHEIAQWVRFHHEKWDHGRGQERGGMPVPVFSHLLHLADRISVLIDNRQEILGQVPQILKTITPQSGHVFLPQHVEAFRDLAGQEAFWLGLTSPSVCQDLKLEFPEGSFVMSLGDFRIFAHMLYKLIDFRSQFTVTHSSGVAAVSEVIGRKTGFDEDKCQALQLAGYLHDIGKLSVPREILEKETALTKEDFQFIRKHPYFSYRILRELDGFHEICLWAAHHHERLDGTGYPFHVSGDQLSVEARLLAVSDTFTALTEVRPYRTSLSGRGTMQIMDRMACSRKIDPEITAIIAKNFDEINGEREKAQQEAFNSHEEFMAELATLRSP